MIEQLIEDTPMLLTLSKNDLILTLAIITLSLTDQDDAFAMLPEMPEELENLANLMSTQKELIMCWLTHRIKEMS